MRPTRRADDDGGDDGTPRRRRRRACGFIRSLLSILHALTSMLAERDSRRRPFARVRVASIEHTNGLSFRPIPACVTIVVVSLGHRTVAIASRHGSVSRRPPRRDLVNSADRVRLIVSTPISAATVADGNPLGSSTRRARLDHDRIADGARTIIRPKERASRSSTHRLIGSRSDCFDGPPARRLLPEEETHHAKYPWPRAGGSDGVARALCGQAVSP